MLYRLALLCSFALFLTTGCGGFIVGSGHLVTIQSDIKDFERLDISSAFEADVVQGNRFSIELEVDDNLREFVVVEQKKDVLRIGLRPFAMYTNTTTRVKIVMPRLKGLEVSGAVKATLDGFCSGHDFSLDASGASTIQFKKFLIGKTDIHLSGASEITGALDTGDISFHLSGASKATIKGSGKTLEIDASGASSFVMDAFPVQNTWIKLSGASHARVSLKGRLDADLSGASTVLYSGDVKLGDIETSGASSVRRHSQK